MKEISASLTEELLNQLELYAMNHKMSRSEAIREAIKRFLEKEDLNTREE